MSEPTEKYTHRPNPVFARPDQKERDLVRAFATYLHARCGDAIDFNLLHLLTIEERDYFDGVIDRIVERKKLR
jgi:hypothetical protein